MINKERLAIWNIGITDVDRGPCPAQTYVNYIIAAVEELGPESIEKLKINERDKCWMHMLIKRRTRSKYKELLQRFPRGRVDIWRKKSD